MTSSTTAARVCERDAQPPIKVGLGTSTNDENSSSKSPVLARCSMESKKTCTTGIRTVKPNQQDREMEAQAATKIQAGFRGYQVRKQLKLKVNNYY